MKKKSHYPANKKWRYWHKELRNAARKRYYAKTRVGNHHRAQPWTDGECAVIMAKVNTDRMLSKLLGRSMEAIQIKRTRIKQCINLK